MEANKYLKVGIDKTKKFSELCDRNQIKMKSLHILLFIIMGGILSIPASGQDAIHIGTRHTLFSQILNEERAYWVYQPEKRAGEPDMNDPVLYLLDSDVFFHSVVEYSLLRSLLYC